MIYDYPFFGLPNYSKMNRPIYSSYINPYQFQIENRKKTEKINKMDEKNKKDSEYPFFTILGSQLYFDDLLIIFIILFLFSEGNNDYYLIFALILLLLS